MSYTSLQSVVDRLVTGGLALTASRARPAPLFCLDEGACFLASAAAQLVAELAAAKKPTEEVFRLDYRIFNSIRPQHEKMGAKKSKKERTLKNVKQEHAKEKEGHLSLFTAQQMLPTANATRTTTQQWLGRARV